MRVCEDWFPKGSRPHQRLDGFEMDDNLARQIEIAVKNVTNDWDFTIIITGGGEVRVGKSVLGFQIAIYWTWLMEKIHGIKVPFDIKKNVVFEWNKLIEQGNKLGSKHHYSALQYDEAGETMEGTKSQSAELKAVRDFLRECGQYNFLNILVMPEFFDLPKGIAITRSIFLIDVAYVSSQDGIFQRGFFKFYSRRNKKLLYMKGKKELNYNAYQYNFDGKFPNFHPIDEKEYRKTKMEALKNRESNKKDIKMLQRDIGWHILKNNFNLTYKEIIDLYSKYGLELKLTTIQTGINRIDIRGRVP